MKRFGESMPSLFASFVLVLAVMPEAAAAAGAGVPAPCRAAITSRWSDWRLSPPPADLARYARRADIETNIVRADFDNDNAGDVAVLLLTSGTRRGQRHLVVCLTRGSDVELHIVHDPYCGDGIRLMPRGTKAMDLDTGRNVTYRTNGIHADCYEKAGATYLFVNGRFRLVIDSD